MEHQIRTLQWHSSCSTTSLHGLRKNYNFTGILRSERHFAVYVGMSVFAKTRKTRKMQFIEMLHENGMSMSFHRVLDISALLGEAVVAQYVEDEVVCPPQPNCIYSPIIFSWHQYVHLSASKLQISR